MKYLQVPSKKERKKESEKEKVRKRK